MAYPVANEQYKMQTPPTDVDTLPTYMTEELRKLTAAQERLQEILDDIDERLVAGGL